MKQLITLAIFVIAVMVGVGSLAGCAGLPSGPLIGSSPKSAAAKGGDAEGETGTVDTTLLIAQPGADATSSKVRNEDQVQSSQAAPAFVLNLVQDFSAAVNDDPVVKSMLASLAVADKTLADASDAAAMDAALSRLTTERTALAERIKTLRSELSESAAAKVESLYYCPVVVMSNAEDTQKLDAAAIEAAGRGLVAAILPALDDKTAQVVAEALKTRPAPTPATEE